MIVVIYKTSKRIYHIAWSTVSRWLTILHMAGNGVQLGYNARFHGVPFVSVHRRGRCFIGTGFTFNSGDANPIGRNTRTYIHVGPGALLTIGDNVGVSNTAIVCQREIRIGSNVKMGGGVVIYDTDFHSLAPAFRRNPITDRERTKTAPVFIENDVFIGAHSTILKGVSIGAGPVIGACSVVTKSIPTGEVWAGNPARFIRAIN